MKFHTISSKDQIDGKLIKHLDHSMGMSIKTLLEKELPEVLKNGKSHKKSDLELESKIIYETYSYNYQFDFKKDGIEGSLRTR